ncbi:hypothetical protein T484DRAFT_2304801 [Baffinella frigidus]|nr:hypothetical protein T484DRAFT_2304801 [Cryptophyta sp. CCMP2293]|mmetsp:Transcript_8839/g.20587  ORF Transcript_8839/g.20587 Transcript_8839/m.20587 type:complete len:229 (+) Transcript_8839:134-820(+)
MNVAEEMAASSPASCSHCGKIAPALQRCSRCKQASYCGAECQKAAWQLHKKTCSLPLEDVRGFFAAEGDVPEPHTKHYLEAPSNRRQRLLAKVLAITGSSRSGKTTLAKMLVVLLRKEGMDVELMEQDNFHCHAKRTKVDGRTSWEGPELTDWGRLEDAVGAAAMRASVVIVEGYMLLDCFERSTALAALLDGVLWVNSTVEQVKNRRKAFPREWGSAANYAQRVPIV